MAERRETPTSPVRIDPETGRLWVFDKPVTMEPRYHRVLALRAQARPDVVSHERIDGALWPDDYKPDNVDEARRKVISYLNKTMGGSYIANVRSEGYRLLEEPAERAPARVRQRLGAQITTSLLTLPASNSTPLMSSEDAPPEVTLYDEFGRVFRQPHTYKGTKIRRSIRIDGYSTVYPDVARQFRDANISAGSTIVAHGSPETGSGLYLSYMFANGPSAEAICAAERGCVMLLDLTCLGFVKLWRNPPPMIIHDDDDVFDYDVAFLVEVVETMISRPS